MRLSDCHNAGDFRRLARRRLPRPIFDFIDGGADDEWSLRNNTSAFEAAELRPAMLTGVDKVDMSVELFGRRLGMPLMLSPAAVQRLMHWQGERAVARAAAEVGAGVGVSSLSTAGFGELAALNPGPKMLQLYVHKDPAINAALMASAKAAGFDCLAVTVDCLFGGNRERDLRSGFTSPPRFTLGSVWQYLAKPAWAWHFLSGERFSMPNLVDHVPPGMLTARSISAYASDMLDQTLDWPKVAELRRQWGDGPFCLKGILSVDDARRAIDVGATAIMVSNHGGRQLDGAPAPFTLIAEMADAVGDQLEIICDGGIRRGTHVLKALAAGAKACSGGRFYLYALAAAGEAGVRRALGNMRAEIERGMQLMGVEKISQLDGTRLRW